MERQKTLEELTQQMNACVAELEAMGPAMRALGDVELLVSFADLEAQFAVPAATASMDGFLQAVRG